MYIFNFQGAFVINQNFLLLFPIVFGRIRGKEGVLMNVNIYNFIDKVIETNNVDKVNTYFEQGYILLNTYAIEVRDEDGKSGYITYSLGHVNVLRNLS